MTAATSSGESARTSAEWENGELVITRPFDAPRALVFGTWTDAEHFARWFGPEGTTLPHCIVDARPGGTLHFCHRHANGEDVWVRGVYHEVVPPERIAFTCWFSDAAGGRVERPAFPAEMRLAATFTEHAGGTLLTIRQAGLVTDQGEVQGWTETMDRLGRLLAHD
ncbi:MAG TPA: SRPBCC domain-containing protein [Longimicrobium sp.]|nr:SRPBCC domain-containing protein [Longimicrobium sp.]